MSTSANPFSQSACTIFTYVFVRIQNGRIVLMCLVCTQTLHLPHHGIFVFQSGAIMGILGYVCTQYPDTKLHIIFLPFFTFAAGTVSLHRHAYK